MVTAADRGELARIPPYLIQCPARLIHFNSALSNVCIASDMRYYQAKNDISRLLDEYAVNKKQIIVSAVQPVRLMLGKRQIRFSQKGHMC